MQKILLVLGALCTSVATYGSPLILTDPIYLTGAGSWYRAIDQANTLVYAYGTTADGSIGAGFSYGCEGASGASVYAERVWPNGQCYTTSSGGIGDVPYRYNGTFSVVLYGSTGTGLYQIFDPDGSLIASAPLIGYIVETSHNQGPTIFDSNGTFSIVPTDPNQQSPVPAPEPSTLLLMACGIAATARRKAAAYPRAR